MEYVDGLTERRDWIDHGADRLGTRDSQGGTSPAWHWQMAPESQMASESHRQARHQRVTDRHDTRVTDRHQESRTDRRDGQTGGMDRQTRTDRRDGQTGRRYEPNPESRGMSPTQRVHETWVWHQDAWSQDGTRQSRQTGWSVDLEVHSKRPLHEFGRTDRPYHPWREGVQRIRLGQIFLCFYKYFNIAFIWFYSLCISGLQVHWKIISLISLLYSEFILV